MSPLARILVGRIGQALMMAWVLATLCFAFVQALPGDTAMRIAAARLGEDRLTAEAVQRIRVAEGLDRPVLVQYMAWLGRTLRGDLGVSLVSRKPVLDEIAYHARFTALLGLLGWLLSYAIALPLGIAAGFNPGGIVDRATMAGAVTLASLPSFLIGIGLVGLFALYLRWLPPAGSRTAAHMVLPALTLALGLAAYSVRIVRNAVVDIRSRFFMTFARIRGLSAAGAFRLHGVRNAAIPIVTYAAMQLAFAIDGFVVIETLFAYPGLGELIVKALLARDLPMIMGTGLCIGLLYAAVSLLADLCCLGLDPRRSAGAAA